MTSQSLETLVGTRTPVGSATLSKGNTVFRLSGGRVMTIGGSVEPVVEHFGYTFTGDPPYFDNAPLWWNLDRAKARKSQMLVGVDPESSYRTFWPVWTQTKPNPFGGFLEPPAPEWSPNRVLVNDDGIVWALAPWFDGPFESGRDLSFDPPGTANVGFRFDPRSGRYVGPIQMDNTTTPLGGPYDLFPFSIFKDVNGLIVVSDGDRTTWLRNDGSIAKHEYVFPNNLDWVMEPVGADIFYFKRIAYNADGSVVTPFPSGGITTSQWGGDRLYSTTTDDLYHGSVVLDLLSWQKAQSYLGKPMGYWYPENHFAVTKDGTLAVGFTGWFGRTATQFPYNLGGGGTSGAVNPTRHGILWIKNGVIIHTTWLTRYDPVVWKQGSQVPWRGSAADPNIFCRGFGDNDILVRMPGDVVIGPIGAPGASYKWDIYLVSPSGSQLVIKDFAGYYNSTDGEFAGALFVYASPGGPISEKSSGVAYEQQRGF